MQREAMAIQAALAKGLRDTQPIYLPEERKLREQQNQIDQLNEQEDSGTVQRELRDLYRQRARVFGELYQRKAHRENGSFTVEALHKRYEAWQDVENKLEAHRRDHRDPGHVRRRHGDRVQAAAAAFPGARADSG